MNTYKVNRWQTLATNLAVVVGIGFLVVEIQQNTAAIRGQASIAVNASLANLNRAIYADAELTDIGFTDGSHWTTLIQWSGKGLGPSSWSGLIWQFTSTGSLSDRTAARKQTLIGQDEGRRLTGPAGVLRPRDGRHDVRQRLGPNVSHHLPDRGVGEQSAVGRHAVRPAVEDRMEERPVFAPVPPAPVYQARSYETDRASALTPAAVHRGEEHFALLGGARVSAERVDEVLGRGREVAGGAVLIVAYGWRCIASCLASL